MLAMMAVIVDYTFKMCFTGGPPNVAGPGVTYSLPTLLLDGPGCVNNALKN